MGAGYPPLAQRGGFVLHVCSKMLLIGNEVGYGKQFTNPWELEPRWQAKFGR